MTRSRSAVRAGKLSPSTLRRIAERRASGEEVEISGPAQHMRSTLDMTGRDRPLHPHLPAFVPSPQQAAFLETVSQPGPSVVLGAVAGAGKTTTLVEAMRVMKGSVAFMAFNTKIVKEIDAKARERGVFDPMRHKISTVHSAGMSAITSRVRGVKVDEKKSLWLARDMAAKAPHLDKLILPAIKLTGLAKQALLLGSKDAQPVWAAMARKHSLDDLIPEGRKMRELVVFAQAILLAGNQERDKRIDFDDMVYLPAAFDDYPIRTYDNVLLDEAQDTNAARRTLARKMLAPGGRVCAVGDRWQALYAFTGADTGALDTIAEEFDAIRMPLSVSYRCPQAVVAEARKHVDTIEAHPTAPMGVVRDARAVPGKLAATGFGPRDAIICRWNKPMIKLAYQLLRENIACKVEGRDIGKNLISMVKKLASSLDGSTTVADFTANLDAWLQEEVVAAQAKGDEGRQRVAEDKHGTIMVFVERAREGGAVPAGEIGNVLCNIIEALFGDDVTDRLVLSSIHKAKGREWKRVWWLQAEGGPKRVLKEWEVETEKCCNYVAITRAQEELIYLTVPQD